MPRHDAVLRLRLEKVGDPEPGAWCGACSLPSVVSVSLVMFVNDEPTGVVTNGLCVECGEAL